MNDKGKPKRPKMKGAMDSVARYLGMPEVGLTIMNGAQDCGDLTRRLTRESATTVDLQRATAEALAYLGYLKRFAAKSGEEERGEED